MPRGAWHTIEGMALMMAGLALLQLEMSVMNALMDLFSGQPVPLKTSEPKPDGHIRTVVNGAQA